MRTVFLFLFVLFDASLADHKKLRCLVCRVTIDEMTKQINSVNPNKKIQVGGYRLDDAGKLEEKLFILPFPAPCFIPYLLFSMQGSNSFVPNLITYLESQTSLPVAMLPWLTTILLEVPFARSGMHLSELMDSICEKMENYVRATEKKSKKLVLLNLFADSNAMNPEISNVDIIQDSDLNKSLTFYCEGIVEEFEDEIYNELKQPSEDPVNGICTKATKLCDSTDKDEL